MQAQLAASVAAEGEDRHRARRRTGAGEELLHERIHAVRVLAQGVTSPFAALGRGFQFLAGAVKAGRIRQIPRHGAR